MIAKYTVAFLGVVFFAITIQAASNPELKNAVEDLIKQLEVQIENLVKAGFDQFDKVLTALVKVLDNILTGFLSAAEGIIDPIIDQIKKISNDAIAKGLNITECAIDDIIAEVEDLPEIFLGEVQTCINALSEAANQTIANGETELNKIVEEVADLAVEASKCGLIDPGCWATLAGKITNAGLTIPGEVANIISVVIKAIADISKSAVECQTTSINKIVLEAKSLLQKVTECVNGKSVY